MSTLSKLLEQAIKLELSTLTEQVDGEMKFWHGGNLSSTSMSDSHEFSQKKGRYEFGPGLYLTTHYDTAKKYSKGGRKLYVISVAKGNELSDVFIPKETVDKFVASFVKPKLREELDNLFNDRVKNGMLRASQVSNLLLNLDAIPSSNTGQLRSFLVANGVDYDIVSSPFGWGESMMVLYNMKKITNIKEVKPSDPENYQDFH